MLRPLPDPLAEPVLPFLHLVSNLLEGGAGGVGGLVGLSLGEAAAEGGGPAPSLAISQSTSSVNFG